MINTMCIYHSQCADGFGAAWAYRHSLRATQDISEETRPDGTHVVLQDDGTTTMFYPGSYGAEPPDVTGIDVVLVDFSYKRPVLLEMSKKAKSILILDHHKSAQEDLDDIVPFASCLIEVVFDMDRSGAGITWDYYFPNKTRPALINHIEDRDLWRFNLRDTREIQAAVFSYPYRFSTWDHLMLSTDLQELVLEGRAIERKHHKDIDEMLETTQRTLRIAGYDVPAANLPYIFSSDACHKMAIHAPFAVCYWDTPKGRTFSLRSAAYGVDVSKIATQYGGGGHYHAAGFFAPWEDVDQFELPKEA